MPFMCLHVSVLILSHLQLNLGLFIITLLWKKILYYFFSTADRSLINPAEVNEPSICVLQRSEIVSPVFGCVAKGTAPFE